MITLVRESKMRVVKVTIEMNGFLMWSTHFTNFPTCKELLSLVPASRKGAPDARAFIKELCPEQWVNHYQPYRVIQYVSSNGLIIGRIVMEEITILECVGADPTKTVDAEAAA
jgi:hypothetical protein